MESVATEDIDRDLADLFTLLDGPRPLVDWFEYRAWLEFTRFLRANYELADELEAAEEGWPESEADFVALLARSRGELAAMGSYRTETERLFLLLRDQGSPLFERICELYCRYRAQIDFVNEAAAAVAIAKGIVQDLWMGLPITTFIALLIKSRLLDKTCDCGNRG
ncbi:hypothetical protein GCM10007973_27120 [Polymorphobacter multimanifer]|uniref:Uncharacterized protein n=1 Tax=Polymorphobacter multimanifer TaxID=1070431 RepID=A0A841LBJ5_9SPHN|nr:hypothetical protein [Polymorphobacter multimanifer]MBB6226522.1 hypothetical protein [Polymorphobacter multimanifer]GGI89314.1 hypothetical protein GCM10007973_27120 [Polymorphobacter multimanifer]